MAAEVPLTFITLELTVNTNWHKHSLPAGFKLLNYKIKSTLGQGGFGTTYLAIDDYLKREVAIKEYMPLEFVVRDFNDCSIKLTDERHKRIFQWGLNRFCMEARTLAKFKHPNIVQVLSLFNKNNTGYMVMEYEDGIQLGHLLEKKNRLSQKQLLSIVLPILSGLDLIHSKGFIHRDIKPANIYIRRNKTPVLLDFGSARLRGTQQAGAMTCLVTHGYTPFEQYARASPDKKVGPWSDIYALAATLYDAICGEKPCDAMIRASEILSNREDPYLRLQDQPQLKKKYTSQFLAAIDTALSFNVEDRPQTSTLWSAMLRGKANPVVSPAPPYIKYLAKLKQRLFKRKRDFH